MNFFKKFLGREPSPQTPSLAKSQALRTRFSGALRPRFGLRRQFTPPTCSIILSPNRGVPTRSNTVSPKPQLPGYTIGPNISFKDYVVGLILIYTSDNILDGRLGGFSENPAWWTRHTGTYSTGNYCTRSFHFSPKCTKIVSGWGSAPDPAGRAYSAPPDPLAVMGWDGDLVTTLLGCKLCAPCSLPVPPRCFEAGYGPDTIMMRFQPSDIHIAQHRTLG